MSLPFPVPAQLSPTSFITARPYVLVRAPRAESEDVLTFGSGSLLEDLPVRSPDVRQSCCEAIWGVLGMQNSMQVAIDNRYQRLTASCAELPARVPGNLRLSRKLAELRNAVIAVNERVVEVYLRDEVFDELGMLCDLATRLRKRLDEQAWLHVQQAEAKKLNPPNPPAVAVPPTASGPMAGPQALVEPAQALRHRLPRRRDRPAVAAAPWVVARPQPEAAAPDPLNAAGQATLRQAIDAALDGADGKGRITGIAALQLGTAVASIQGGRYPGRVLHAPSARAYRETIGGTIDRATDYMQEPYRQAIRTFADAYLRRPDGQD